MCCPVDVRREGRGERHDDRRDHDEQLTVALRLALVGDLFPVVKSSEELGFDQHDGVDRTADRSLALLA